MKVTDLDDLLGIPARLAIIATVATLPASRGAKRWTFTVLREETGLADGNLHVQTRKLTTAGYLHRHRVRQGNRQVTCFDLTEKGRRSLRLLIGLLRDALEGGSGFSDLSADKPMAPPGSDDFQVW